MISIRLRLAEENGCSGSGCGCCSWLAGVPVCRAGRGSRLLIGVSIQTPYTALVSPLPARGAARAGRDWTSAESPHSLPEGLLDLRAT